MCVCVYHRTCSLVTIVKDAEEKVTLMQFGLMTRSILNFDE